MAALVVSCLFAAILGFAAHRASVCTVRAIAELTSSRTGYMTAQHRKVIDFGLSGDDAFLLGDAGCQREIDWLASNPLPLSAVSYSVLEPVPMAVPVVN